MRMLLVKTENEGLRLARGELNLCVGESACEGAGFGG